MLERYQRWLLPVGILTLLLGASLATARRSSRPLPSTIQSTSPDVTLSLRLNECDLTHNLTSVWRLRN